MAADTVRMLFIMNNKMAVMRVLKPNMHLRRHACIILKEDASGFVKDRFGLLSGFLPLLDARAATERLNLFIERATSPYPPVYS